MKFDKMFLNFSGFFHCEMKPDIEAKDFKGTWYNVHFEPVDDKTYRMYTFIGLLTMNDYQLIDAPGGDPKVVKKNYTEGAEEFYDSIIKGSTYIDFKQAFAANPANFFIKKDATVKKTNNFNCYYRDMDLVEVDRMIKILTKQMQESTPKGTSAPNGPGAPSGASGTRPGTGA